MKLKPRRIGDSATYPVIWGIASDYELVQTRVTDEVENLFEEILANMKFALLQALQARMYRASQEAHQP